MNKMVYRLMSVIVAFALTLGVYFSAGASSASAPLMSPIAYYVSVNGNDANAGTSAATAWKTLSKVRSRTYSAGDKILLEAGKVWSEGTFTFPGSGITLGRYGTGANPVINSTSGPAIRHTGLHLAVA